MLVIVIVTRATFTIPLSMATLTIVILPNGDGGSHGHCNLRSRFAVTFLMAVICMITGVPMIGIVISMTTEMASIIPAVGNSLFLP